MEHTVTMTFCLHCPAQGLPCPDQGKQEARPEYLCPWDTERETGMK